MKGSAPVPAEEPRGAWVRTDGGDQEPLHAERRQGRHDDAVERAARAFPHLGRRERGAVLVGERCGVGPADELLEGLAGRGGHAVEVRGRIEQDQRDAVSRNQTGSMRDQSNRERVGVERAAEIAAGLDDVPSLDGERVYAPARQERRAPRALEHISPEDRQERAHDQREQQGRGARTGEEPLRGQRRREAPAEPAGDHRLHTRAPGEDQRRRDHEDADHAGEQLEIGARERQQRKDVRSQRQEIDGPERPRPPSRRRPLRARQGDHVQHAQLPVDQGASLEVLPGHDRVEDEPGHQRGHPDVERQAQSGAHQPAAHARVRLAGGGGIFVTVRGHGSPAAATRGRSRHG